MLREIAIQQAVLVALLAGCGTTTREADSNHVALADGQQAARSVERNRFERLYADWRTIVGDLRDLDIKYQTVPTHGRDKLVTRYEQLVAEGTQMQEQVIQAAVVTYAKAPEENTDLVTFLIGVVYLLADQEEYEEALRIAQLLIDCGVCRGDLYTLAGMTAFVTAEFHLAEKHLRCAAKEQPLQGMAARYLGDIQYYKTAWEREKKLRSAEMLAADLPRVLLKTSQGEIELELFQNEAPNTVANFVRLVEQGFYNGLAFHRVIPQYLAESGCPTGDGTGGPGYTIPNESHRKDHRLHFRGSLGMARSGRDTSGSQFYLTFVPLRRRDGSCTVFGRIVRGGDVLARLQRREPLDPVTKRINPRSSDVAPPADTIIETKVLRKGTGSHPPRPQTYQTLQASDDLRVAEP